MFCAVAGNKNCMSCNVVLFARVLEWTNSHFEMKWIYCIVGCWSVLYSNQCRRNTRFFQSPHSLNTYLYISVYRLIFLLALPEYCYYFTITIFPCLTRNALSVSCYSPVACYKVCLILSSHFQADVKQSFFNAFYLSNIGTMFSYRPHSRSCSTIYNLKAIFPPFRFWTLCLTFCLPKYRVYRPLSNLFIFTSHSIHSIILFYFSRFLYIHSHNSLHTTVFQ